MGYEDRVGIGRRVRRREVGYGECVMGGEMLGTGWV